MLRKRIISFNLEDGLISKLDRYAEEEHKGNRSKALAYLVSRIPTNLKDFPDEEHTAPHQNFRDTGKCSPFHKGLAPCATCWGENVKVEWADGVLPNGFMGRVLVVTELEE